MTEAEKFIESKASLLVAGKYNMCVVDKSDALIAVQIAWLEGRLWVYGEHCDCDGRDEALKKLAALKKQHGIQ